MIPVFVQRDTVFKSYENQVLFTQGLYSARKIIVIIHDPPELMAQPDPLDNTVEPHNAWINDGVMEYIDWAVGKNFGVVDINVPHYVTHSEDSESFIPSSDEGTMQAQIQELVCYIWDNYLQVLDATEEIFLLGVGAAYLGVKVLLINRDCKSRISGVVNFVTGSLRPIKSDVDPELSLWYKDNSHVYVANNHACWANPELNRKINKRRFGAVKRSAVSGLNPMMREHAEDAQQWIMSRVGGGHGDTTEDENTR